MSVHLPGGNFLEKEVFRACVVFQHSAAGDPDDPLHILMEKQDKT